MILKSTYALKRSKRFFLNHLGFKLAVSVSSCFAQTAAVITICAVSTDPRTLGNKAPTREYHYTLAAAHYRLNDYLACRSAVNKALEVRGDSEGRFRLHLYQTHKQYIEIGTSICQSTLPWSNRYCSIHNSIYDWSKLVTLRWWIFQAVFHIVWFSLLLVAQLVSRRTWNVSVKGVNPSGWLDMSRIA